MENLSVSFVRSRSGEENATDALRELPRFMPDGTDVLLLPEFWARDAEDSARSLDALSAVCAEQSVFAVSGGMPWDDGGRKVIRTWALGDSGEKIAWQDKAHLSSTLGEDKIYNPGNRPVIFSFGKAVCVALSGYDLMFPEYCRQISLAGVDVFFVSASFGGKFAHIIEPLIVSAAFTNQCFVAFCDKNAAALVSPLGEIIALTESGHNVASASLKLPDVQRARKHIPLERDRRGEIYVVFP